jgi:hypothetical protein
MSYGNVTATLALFIALGGTSYAVTQIGSGDVRDESLRSVDIRDGTIKSRDVKNRALRSRDVRRNGLGGDVIRESSLGVVPEASNAARLGGVPLQDLRLECPSDTVAKIGLCIESNAKPLSGFFSASDECAARGRALPTVAQLDSFARSSGPLSQAEWTSSVYRNPDNGPGPAEQLEAVVLEGLGAVSYDRVYAPVQHAFRCVALPSN